MISLSQSNSKPLKRLKRFRNIGIICKSLLEKINIQINWLDELNRTLKDGVDALQRTSTLASFDFEALTKHNNKKLFILGSGASLNTMTAQDWAEVKLNYSFSFNFFLAHEFTANIHFIESCSANHEQKIYYDLISSLPQKQLIPYVMNLLHYTESILPIPDEILHLFFSQSPFRWPTSDRKLMRFLLKYGKFIFPISKPNFGIHHSSSVCYLINLGVRLGFKEIILVGVDMNNTDYFFYDQNDEISKELTKIYMSYYNKETGEVKHRITDSKITNAYNALTTPEFIQLYTDLVCNRNGVNLQVANPKSLLAEFLPVYKFSTKT